MSKLSAIFSLVDEMSSKMDAISSSGTKALNSIDDAANAADSAFNSAASNAEAAVGAIDNVSRSLNNYGNSLNSSQSAVDDYSADLEEMFGVCEQAADNLCKSLEASEDIHEKLSEAAGESSKAVRELEVAQVAANVAMNDYDRVIISGTTDLGELERAAEQAQHAAENLAAANEKAADTIEDISNKADEAGDEGEEAGEKGENAAEMISTALATLGITEKLKDITEAVVEMSEEFSEAESTVVKATGATSDALAGLEDSMMAAYSVARNADLDSTAAAVGEINTRLSFTGEKLTDTTEKFLDFASATGSDVTASVRTVTQLMNQWGVSTDKLSVTLDKLTYAGQVSGISVNGLTSQLTTNKAILDLLGFSLDESIALFSQFELKGANVSAIMMGLRTAVSSGAVSSLEELYDVFEKIQSGIITTSEAADLFGTRAGPAIVNAVKDGSFAIDGMVGSLESAQGTLETTAEASQTMEQKMNQAQNSIKTAFTEAVQPVSDGINETLANLLDGVGRFLQENPTVTKAITAFAASLAVVVAGIAGVTFVTKVAVPALKSLGTAITTSMGPLGWVALGITAVTTAAAALTTMLSKNTNEFDNLTESSKKQYNELQDMNAEYEKTCEKFGETSDEARAMKYDLDEATESFNSNKMSVSELYAEIDSLHSAHLETMESYRNTNAEIDNQQESAEVLIAKLKELNSTGSKTAGTQEQMKAIVDRLNEAYPQLGASIDGVNGNLEDLIANFEAASGAESKQAKYENAKATYAKLLEEQKSLQKARDEAEAVMLAKGEALSEHTGEAILQSFCAKLTGQGAGEIEKAYDEASEAYFKVAGDLNENNAAIAECEAILKEYGEIVSGTSDEAVSAYDAISIAVKDVSEQAQQLIEKYNEAYAAASDSVSGQYSIWENAAQVIPTSIGNINAALDSQIQYWDGYNDNLTTLLGKTDSIDGLQEVLASFSDGSAESVNAIAGMASASDEELKKMVENYKKLQEQQDKTATSLADTRVDFESELDKLTTSMKDTVDDMNLEDEARAAATATIEAYAKAIEATKGKAVDAAAAVSAATGEALAQAYKASSTTYGSSSENSVTGYAVGTVDAKPGLALVGEEGPELIKFDGGEVVYPTDKTAKILDGLGSEKDYKTAMPEVNRDNFTGSNEKKITLEVVGQGAISVGKGTDKNAIIDVLQENLRPVLLRLIQDEIYEEGDGTYDY